MKQFGHVEYYFIVFFHMMAQNLGIYQELVLPYFDSSKSSRELNVEGQEVQCLFFYQV